MNLDLIVDNFNFINYDPKINYIGNYKLQKLYSFLFQNFLFKQVLNKSAYIHDLQYSKFFKLENKTFKKKFLIDLNFLINNFLCIFIWFDISNSKLLYVKFIYLFLISQIFFFLVILATPFYFLKK